MVSSVIVLGTTGAFHVTSSNKFVSSKSPEELQSKLTVEHGAVDAVIHGIEEDPQLELVGWVRQSHGLERLEGSIPWH